MPIAVDARTPGNQTLGASVAGGTSVSWTHPLGAGLSNGFLAVSGAQDAAANSTGVNWDQTGTPVAFTGRKGTVTQGACRAELWYLKAPAPSGTKTIRVSWSGSHDGGFQSASYSGVDQTTIFNAASPQSATGASGTNPSLTGTSTNGEMVIDAMVQDLTSSGAATPTKGASQNYLGAGLPSATSIAIGSSDRAAVGTTTAMTWTVTTTKGAWGQVLMSLLPASSGTLFTQALTGVLSFTGDQSKFTNFHLTGALTFAGNGPSRFITHLANATLSFTGALTKLTLKGAFTGALDFVGNLTTSIVKNVFLTAALSFSGAMAKQTGKALSGGVSFSGDRSTFIAKGLAAAVSFAGAVSKQTSKFFTGSLTFTGSLSKRILKGLTAALDFSGNLVTLLIHGGGTLFTMAFTAALGFTGAVGKRTTKKFTASLGTTGSGIGSAPIVLVGFRLAKRIKGIFYEWLT